MIVERRVKLVTEQHDIDKPPQQEGFPMKEWSVKLYLLDEDNNEHPASVFTKVMYKLHPSFKNPVQTFTTPPFICSNEGWGEFEMEIELYTTEKGKISIQHDLNFQQPMYETIRNVIFKNPSQALQEKLRETGPLPSDSDPRSKKKAGGAAGSSAAAGPPVAGPSGKKKFDYEKIADAMARLEEEDLLRVIQMINDGKTDTTYIKSDVDAGEFSIDLYTMSEPLTKQLAEYLNQKGLIV